MSRLVDELKKMAGTTPQPMGFGTSRAAASQPKLLLVAAQVPGAAGQIASSLEGADAVLLRLNKSDVSAGTLEEISNSLSGMIWGCWVEDISAKKVGTLVGAGCDFLVFPGASPVSSAPENKKTGKLLQVELSLEDSLLQSVNDLPVDAVLVTGSSGTGRPMAWLDVLRVQRLANLVTIPLLVPAPADIAAEELKVLWETGIDGILVEVEPEKPGGLKAVRELINGLPARSVRRRGKAGALLPYSGSLRSAEIEEEEEEEEDY